MDVHFYRRFTRKNEWVLSKKSLRQLEMVVAVKILQLAKEIIEERKLAKEEVDESMVSSSLGKDAGVSLPMTCRWRITHQSYGGGYIFF